MDRPLAAPRVFTGVKAFRRGRFRRGEWYSNEQANQISRLVYTIFWYRMESGRFGYLDLMRDRKQGTTWVDPRWWMTFVEVGAFPAAWKKLGLGDQELRELQRTLLESPEAGDVVVGTGGLRKVRFSPSTWNRGKSGALRVYYALFERFGTVFLVFIHDKNYAETMPAAEKATVKAWLERMDRAFRDSEKRRSRT